MKPEFRLTEGVVGKFFGSFIPEPNSGCWLWEGPLGEGYGLSWSGTRSTGAHRLSWAIHRGPIPPKMTVDHRECRLKCCVNPDHLVVCTHAENMLQSDGMIHLTHSLTILGCIHTHQMGAPSLLSW